MNMEKPGKSKRVVIQQSPVPTYDESNVKICMYVIRYLSTMKLLKNIFNNKTNRVQKHLARVGIMVVNFDIAIVSVLAIYCVLV